MAMKYQKPTIEDLIREYDTATREEHQPELKRLEEQKAKIVKDYVDRQDYESIKSNEDIQKIDNEIDKIRDIIKTKIKTFSIEKAKEEKEKERRCFGALEYELTRGVDKERNSMKHRFDLIAPTSLGLFTTKITGANASGLEKLYISFFERMCSLEKASV